MTQEQIEEINSKCPSDQGIFKEPWAIPCHIKEPVIYCKYETGGVTGGSCWGTDYRSYTNDPPADRFAVLDLVVEMLKPNITYLQYKKIDSMIHDNTETDYGDYYGNSSDYKVEYIILSELEEFLNTI